LRTVTLIAKGPSASRADEFIAAAHGTDVATVNDSGELTTSRIDFCFIQHSWLIPDVEPHKDRVCKFVSEMSDGPEWFISRLIKIQTEPCAGSIQDLQDRILSGGLCQHNTANGALHWLAKHGRYEKIRIIGIDGGVEYASGVNLPSESERARIAKAEKRSDFLTLWREVTQNLVSVLQSVYGVEIEWMKLCG
jgi:hypothetical protein